MSPRWKSVIFCTATRSPISSVFSIDPDGMMNICPTNARSSEETTKAPTTTINSSRTNEPNRLPPRRFWVAVSPLTDSPSSRSTRPVAVANRVRSTVGLRSGLDHGFGRCRLDGPARQRTSRERPQVRIADGPGHRDCSTDHEIGRDEGVLALAVPGTGDRSGGSGSPGCAPRLSPMTKIRSAGTITSKLISTDGDRPRPATEEVLRLVQRVRR